MTSQATPGVLTHACSRIHFVSERAYLPVGVTFAPPGTTSFAASELVTFPSPAPTRFVVPHTLVQREHCGDQREKTPTLKMVLRILQLNYGGGFNAKTPEVLHWCEQHGCDIICVTETWLCGRECAHDHECRRAQDFKGWIFHGRGREDGRERGGGVGFLVRDSVPFRPRQDLENEGEHVWIELLPKGASPVLLCSVYVVQNLTPAQAFRGLRKSTRSAFEQTTRTIITGDFNSRCIAFGDQVDTRYGEEALSYMIDSDFELCNSVGVPTRIDYSGTESVLDLTLVHESMAEVVTSWQAHEEFASDHAGVTFDMNLPGRARRPKPKREVWGLDKCDWQRFHDRLQCELASWREQSIDAADSDTLYRSWLKSVFRVVEDVVPRRVISESSKPYWSKELQRLSDARVRALKCKNKARRMGRLNDTLRARYREAHCAFLAASINARRSWMERILTAPDSTTPEAMWPRIKRVRASRPTPIAAVQVEDTVHTDPKRMADSINEYFAARGDDSELKFDSDFKRVVQEELRRNPPSQCCHPGREPNDTDDCTWCKPITLDEIRGRIARLKRRKSPGADDILPEFIIHGGDEMVLSLQVLFNHSFFSSSLPFLWRLAEVVPVRKARRGCKASDFRPISLLSVVGKLLDGIIADRLSHHAETNRWFPPFMGGFRRGRSSIDQVLHFTEDVFAAFRARKVCVTAFLDLSAAYDRLYREGLLVILANQGVKGRTLSWINAFVRSRYGRVRIDSTRSSRLSYEFGVPQGSCLSPILFNLFMCDLTDFLVVPDGVQISIYADDIRVSAFDHSPEVAARLVSNVLDQINEWASKMRIVFDLESSKCGYMIFSTRRKEDQVVSFGSSYLKRVDKPHRYLGVWLDPTLSFRHHINVIRGKAWAALQSIRPLAQHVSFGTMRTLYVSCVRPILEYASSVWNSAAPTYTGSLDKVQRVALRVISGADRTTSLETLQAYCSVLSLQARRDIALGNDYHRAARLSTQHPLAAQMAASEGVGEAALHRRSYVYSAKALFRQLQRYSPFELGSTVKIEPIPDFELKKPPLRFAPVTKPQRQRRIEEHLRLLATPPPVNELWVHTDGSANPNPGPCGFGIIFDSQSTWEIQYAPIGLGSNFTAELLAILAALRTLVQHRVRFTKIRIFSDCLPAVKTARGEIPPKSHVSQVVEIQRLLKAMQGRTEIEWIPGHEGIPPNEIADRLAKLSVSHIFDCRSPMREQPGIPLVIARNFVRSAVVRRETSRWRKIAFDHKRDGAEHLSRLLLTVPRKPVLYYGTRKTLHILTKLRTANCQLNAPAARKRNTVEPMCDCNLENETVSHFLLRCPLFDVQRVALFEQVWTVHPPPAPITEETLLGCPPHLRETKKAKIIYNAVVRFVRSTRREI